MSFAGMSHHNLHCTERPALTAAAAMVLVFAVNSLFLVASQGSVAGVEASCDHGRWTPDCRHSLCEPPSGV